MTGVKGLRPSQHHFSHPEKLVCDTGDKSFTNPTIPKAISHVVDRPSVSTGLDGPDPNLQRLCTMCQDAIKTFITIF